VFFHQAGGLLAESSDQQFNSWFGVLSRVVLRLTHPETIILNGVVFDQILLDFSGTLPHQLS
jgi:hypothetical protein